MAADLFAAAAEERLESRAPLAARLRPQTLDEVVGQQHLLAPGRPLRALIEGDRLSSVILWGPPGTGKTTIARLIAGATDKAFEPLSAVNAGVKDVREVVERANNRLGERGQGTILFLDEVHRFNKTQQDALLPHVEDGLLVLVGATTENPYFSLDVRAAQPLDAVPARAARARGPARARWSARSPTRPAASAATGSTIDDDALDHLADRSEGDARHALTSLEVAGALTAEAGRAVDHARVRRGRARDARRCATATTSTTTSSPRSSRASAAPTPTPGSTGWRACSRRGRTRASSPAGS